MKITLKDGSVREYAQPMAVIDIAKDISEGLARMACVAEIDGEVKDLRTVIDQDCSLNILTAKDPEGLAALRHTASHVMAQAEKRLWPDTKLAIGPSIADGFYYDVDPVQPLTAEDLEKIEAEMKKIIKEALPLERFELPREEAIAFMKEKNEPYKVELIEDLPEGEEICDMATNYMDEYGDGTEETLLYIATYNPSRASEKKGSVYVYDIATQTLQKSYEGICDRPVRLMYKYRIS